MIIITLPGSEDIYPFDICDDIRMWIIHALGYEKF